MEIFGYLLTFLVLAVLVTLYILGKVKILKINTDLMVKILNYVLIAVFIFRYMWDRDAIQETFALENIVFTSKFVNALVIIVEWLVYASIILTCMYPFFKEVKGINVIVKYFALPVGILSFGLYHFLAQGICGSDVFNGFSFRATLMAIENALLITLAFAVFWENGKFKVDNKRDLLYLLFIIPMLFFTIQPYLLQGLFGYSKVNLIIKKLSIPHRILMYGSILLPILIYFVFHNENYKTRKFAVLFISLGTLLAFSCSSRFPTFKDVTSWPLHLCNTAMYIMPLCLIFNWKRLFYFTYFINVLGAFLAMAMPNYADETNLFSSGCVRFFINHYIAFYMPLLVVALRVYERPKLKQFIWSMVGFGAYFALVLIFNAWFSNYGTCDYFFINSDFIAEKLGTWAENLRNITWSFTISGLKFVFYPVYQIIFFLVYVLLGLAMWFVYEQGYAIVDTLKDISVRNKKIKVDRLALEVSSSNNNGVKMEEIKNVQLQLKGFSKRYGSSQVYAVRDANLDIHGGEIFGFLGHNGAGKSTIIKSMVGIQPITSGAIEVCGYDVDKQPVMTKRLIGFVPDHYALYEKLTGREYINYIADLWGVSKEDRDKRIEYYVNLFELVGSFDNQIKTYSHGMKQKITIISALIHEPKVWILDEPLTGLDPNSIFQVKECMKNHAKKGNIVFFSSHIIDVVESICDRIAIIRKGKILVTKSIKEINDDCGLEQFYLKTISQGELEDIDTNDDFENLPKDTQTENKEIKEEKSKKTKKESNVKKEKSLKTKENLKRKDIKTIDDNEKSTDKNNKNLDKENNTPSDNIDKIQNTNLDSNITDSTDKLKKPKKGSKKA